MPVIYRTSDRIEIKIDDFKIKIKPMSFEEKSQVIAEIQKAQQTKDMASLQKASLMPIRLALKSIEGVEDINGEPYSLQFDENNHLTDECLNEVLSLSEKLTQVCMATLNGLPNEWEIEGVSFSSKKKPRKS